MQLWNAFWSGQTTVDARFLVSLFAVVLVFIVLERFGR